MYNMYSVFCPLLKVLSAFCLFPCLKTNYRQVKHMLKKFPIRQILKKICTNLNFNPTFILLYKAWSTSMNIKILRLFPESWAGLVICPNSYTLRILSIDINIYEYVSLGKIQDLETLSVQSRDRKLASHLFSSLLWMI